MMGMGEAEAQGEAWCDGRYELGRVVGRGAMGVVFAANDTHSGFPVALKTVRTPSPAVLYRLKQEFRKLTEIAHPNLVSIYELAYHEPHWFFTMELLEGVSFLRYIRGEDAGAVGSAVRRANEAPEPRTGTDTGTGTGTTLGEDNLRTSTEQIKDGQPGRASLTRRVRRLDGSAEVCIDEQRLRSALSMLSKGVQALHERALLHRDLKPSNVMVTAEGRVVLLDFGVLTDLREGEESVVAGTVPYMAPEALRTSELSPAADWYGVGVILYEALTGMRPMDFAKEPTLAAVRMMGRPPSPQLVNAAAPKDLAALALSLLEVDVQARGGYLDIQRTLGESSVSETSVGVTQSGEQPLFGRDAQLAQLEQAKHLAWQQGASLVTIEGEAGMGRTALLDAFLKRAKEQGAVVLGGRCHSQEHVPYKALDAVIDAAAQYVSRLPERDRADLVFNDLVYAARIFPVLTQIPELEGTASDLPKNVSPQAIKRRAHLALRELFHRLANAAPTIIAIDDLHWGDLDSLPLLQALLSEVEAPRLMFVATYATECTDAALIAALREDRRGRDSRDVALMVRPLEATDCEALITAHDGGAFDDDTPRTLFRESRGNPRLLGELLQYLTDADSSHTQATTLGEVMASRIKRLGEDARTLLEVVAVAGGPQRTQVVQEVSALGPAATRALRTLRVGRFLASSQRDGYDLVACAHESLRHSVLSRLLPAEQRAMHRRIAAVLRKTKNFDPEDLSIHLFAAGEPIEGSHFAEQAAINAEQALAFGRAAELYERALSPYEEPTEPADVARAHRLRIALAQAMVNDGRSYDAATLYAAIAADASGDARSDLQRLSSLYYITSGRIDEGLSVMREVMRAVGIRIPQTPTRALVRLAFTRAVLALRGLRFRSRKNAPPDARTLLRVDAYHTGASCLGCVDNIRGADFMAKGLLAALRAGDPLRVARSLILESFFYSVAGERHEKATYRLVDRAQALSRDLDAPDLQMQIPAAWAGYHYQTTGRFQDALRFADLALEKHRVHMGFPLERTNTELLALWSLYYLGDAGQLIARSEEMLHTAEDRGDLYASTCARTGVPSFARLAQNKPEVALAQCKAAKDQWTGTHGQQLQHYWATFGLAQAQLYDGDPLAAYDTLKLAWPKYRRAMILGIDTVLCEAGHLRASAALMAARTATHRAPLLNEVKRTARMLSKRKLYWKRALGLLLLAGLDSTRGDTEAAIKRFEQARQVADDGHLALFALSAQHAVSTLREDKAMLAATENEMRERGVVSPDRIARLLAPHWGQTC